MTWNNAYDIIKINEHITQTIKEEMFDGNLDDGRKEISIAGQFERRDGRKIQVQIILFNNRVRLV